MLRGLTKSLIGLANSFVVTLDASSGKIPEGLELHVEMRNGMRGVVVPEAHLESDYSGRKRSDSLFCS